MALFQNNTFRNDTVHLDGNEFDGCKFENCRFIYRGTAATKMANCSFFGFTIVLEGAAANTLDFMQALYHGGFKPTIEKAFDNIRLGNTPSGQWTIH